MVANAHAPTATRSSTPPMTAARNRSEREMRCLITSHLHLWHLGFFELRFNRECSLDHDKLVRFQSANDSPAITNASNFHFACFESRTAFAVRFCNQNDRLPAKSLDCSVGNGWIGLGDAATHPRCGEHLGFQSLAGIYNFSADRQRARSWIKRCSHTLNTRSECVCGE